MSAPQDVCCSLIDKTTSEHLRILTGPLSNYAALLVTDGSTTMTNLQTKPEPATDFDFVRRWACAQRWFRLGAETRAKQHPETRVSVSAVEKRNVLVTGGQAMSGGRSN